MLFDHRAAAAGVVMDQRAVGFEPAVDVGELHRERAARARNLRIDVQDAALRFRPHSRVEIAARAEAAALVSRRESGFTAVRLHNAALS